MEAVRAGAKSGSLVPVEVEEAYMINSEVLCSWVDDTMWL